jgi:hypothetical protein
MYTTYLIPPLLLIRLLHTLSLQYSLYVYYIPYPSITSYTYTTYLIPPLLLMPYPSVTSPALSFCYSLYLIPLLLLMPYPFVTPYALSLCYSLCIIPLLLLVPYPSVTPYCSDTLTFGKPNSSRQWYNNSLSSLIFIFLLNIWRNFQ